MNKILITGKSVRHNGRQLATKEYVIGDGPDEIDGKSADRLIKLNVAVAGGTKEAREAKTEIEAQTETETEKPARSATKKGR